MFPPFEKCVGRSRSVSRNAGQLGGGLSRQAESARHTGLAAPTRAPRRVSPRSRGPRSVAALSGDKAEKFGGKLLAFFELLDQPDSI